MESNFLCSNFGYTTYVIPSKWIFISLILFFIVYKVRILTDLISWPVSILMKKNTKNTNEEEY